MTGLYLVLAAVLAAAAWCVSLRLWPLKRCPRCRGTGLRPGPWGGEFGACGRCHRSGEVRRLGARRR